MTGKTSNSADIGQTPSKSGGRTPRIVTFGELMLRLSPPGFERLFQSPALVATFGGGEANVAVSLSTLGLDAAFVSRFPPGPIGDAALGELRRHGVDCTGVVRGGERLGIYFCEKGASQRPSRVVYDRLGSSISQATLADFDWPALLAGADWFHFTGITPALSPACAELCLAACQAARKLGVKTSCDLNYRKKLWTPAQAGQTMARLMPLVDLLIANEEDAEKVFGIKAAHSDVTGGTLDHQAYVAVAQALEEGFGIKECAITLRQSHSASVNGWAGMFRSGGQAVFSRDYAIQIVDRVGGGDSFGAGLIYARLSGMDAQASIDFAVAASCLKHSIEGDFNLVGLEEIQALAAGDGSGRVQR